MVRLEKIISCSLFLTEKGFQTNVNKAKWCIKLAKGCMWIKIYFLSSRSPGSCLGDILKQNLVTTPKNRYLEYLGAIKTRFKKNVVLIKDRLIVSKPTRKMAMMWVEKYVFPQALNVFQINNQSLKDSFCFNWWCHPNTLQKSKRHPSFCFNCLWIETVKCQDMESINKTLIWFLK